MKYFSFFNLFLLVTWTRKGSSLCHPDSLEVLYMLCRSNIKQKVPIEILFFFLTYFCLSPGQGWPQFYATRTAYKCFSYLLGPISIVYCLLFTKGFPRAEGVDTEENELSQEPLDEPLRHYTIQVHVHP